MYLKWFMTLQWDSLHVNSQCIQCIYNDVLIRCVVKLSRSFPKKINETGNSQQNKEMRCRMVDRRFPSNTNTMLWEKLMKMNFKLNEITENQTTSLTFKENKWTQENSITIKRWRTFKKWNIQIKILILICNCVIPKHIVHQHDSINTDRRSRVVSQKNLLAEPRRTSPILSQSSEPVFAEPGGAPEPELLSPLNRSSWAPEPNNIIS